MTYKIHIKVMKMYNVQKQYVPQYCYIYSLQNTCEAHTVLNERVASEPSGRKIHTLVLKQKDLKNLQGICQYDKMHLQNKG